MSPHDYELAGKAIEAKISSLTREVLQAGDQLLDWNANEYRVLAGYWLDLAKCFELSPSTMIGIDAFVGTMQVLGGAARLHGDPDLPEATLAGTALESLCSALSECFGRGAENAQEGASNNRPYGQQPDRIHWEQKFVGLAITSKQVLSGTGWATYHRSMIRTGEYRLILESLEGLVDYLNSSGETKVSCEFALFLDGLMGSAISAAYSVRSDPLEVGASRKVGSDLLNVLRRLHSPR